MAKAYFGNGAAFSRVMMYAQLLAGMTLGASKMPLPSAIAKLGAYESRGHGRGKRSGVRVKAYAKMRAQHNEAIQGKQEIARRLARGLDGQCGVLHG